MSNRIVHNMASAWVSSDAALVTTTTDTGSFPGPGAVSNLLTAGSGSTGTAVSFTPAAPDDLSPFSEIRFWIRASRPANGRPATPFFLEFSYRVSTDPPGQRRRWLVPVNRANHWEHRRIGIASDARNPISDYQFRSLSDDPFECRIAELLAVQPEMQADADEALRGLLEANVTLPDQGNLPLIALAATGTSQVRVAQTSGFAVDNMVLIRNAAGDTETRQLTSVADDGAAIPPATVLDFAGDPLPVDFPALTSSVSLFAPVMFVSKIGPILPVTPGVLVSSLSVMEDYGRTGYYRQRDSFRRNGGQLISSTRAAPRAYRLVYQVIVRAQDRAQEIFLQDQVLAVLSIQNGLRINGLQAPVSVLPGQTLGERETGYPVYLSQFTPPAYIAVGTYMDVDTRSAATHVQTATVGADHRSPPHDPEIITVTL
jgi:hypothetical protein